MSGYPYNMDWDSIPGSREKTPGLDFICNISSDAELSAKLLYIHSHKQENHRHNVMRNYGLSVLLYITGGRGEFRLETTCFTLGPGDMLIINPQAMHTEIATAESSLDYICLGIQGLAFHRGCAVEHQDYHLLHFREGHDEMQYLLRMLLREMQGSEGSRTVMCQNLLNVLFLQILRQKQLVLASSFLKQASRECARVRQYIETHFKESLTLDKLAEKAHLNKFYMSHEFKAAYGLSPINYLIACRVRESKHLLATTDLSLAQIAAIVGFSSASYFSQSFKKAVRISPQEYRRLTKHSRHDSVKSEPRMLEAGL